MSGDDTSIGPQEGGCQCGRVRFRLRGEPLTSYACHCTECQAATGAAFSLSLIVAREALEVIRGTAAATTYGMHGSDRHRYACPDCGSALWFAGAGMPEIVALKTGTLDHPDLCPPVAHVWTRSAQSWFPLPEGVPAWPGQPEMETLLALWQGRATRSADTAAPPGARQVVAAWVQAFNRGDADEVAGFYADDAVNHQVTRGLLPEQPEDQGQHEAHQDHGRDRQVEGETFPSDDDVAGQAAERQAAEPGPQQADDDDRQADDDERLLHGCGPLPAL